MKFETIRISNIRNISSAEFAPGPAINIISGKNGSGKTSLLEAIYIFGRGKSFRETRLRSIIQENKKSLLVQGAGYRGERRIIIGVEKTLSKTTIKINAEKILKLSVLAKILPIQIVNPNIQYLFESEPLYRRRLIDWGLFHVEPGFQELSRRYKRALSQRNLAIRSGQRSYIAWEPELCRLNEIINDFRVAYISKLTIKFAEYLKKLGFEQDLQINWKSGWNKDLTVSDVFQRNRNTDLSRGFTQAGAHRADFIISKNLEPIAKHASRGEQKMIAAALLFAQNQTIASAIKICPVLLVDDLASELDKLNRERLSKLMSELTGCQIFLTTLDPDLFQDLSEALLFHVEHGVVSAEGV